ncbi:peptidoglycan recognition protein [Janibacter sp. YB324]|uniref:peptidoglycan recognition protein family protein n=1 Tax=Janibacter sp. YB324 TaxID=2761047 RepID=UPI0016279FEB|nr:peptidoglycan recognition protein [Janibacter sp. YB324]QNF93710.1 peptidoglycan recognition protein [Janibacter sp. YB324]
MSSLRRALSRLTITALATSLVTVIPASGGSAAPSPVAAQRDSIPVPGVDRAALSKAPKVPSAGRSGDRVVGMTDTIATQDFRVAGLTWDGSRIDVEAFVRTRDAQTGRWSGWSLLEAEGGPDAGTAEAAAAQGGTQPLVTAPSDGIQVRVESAGARPQGLEVDVIDPGTSTADATAGSDATSLSTADETNPQKRPTIHSRAEWGADESIRKGDPDYGEVRGAVLHHTAGVNGYSREEVPAIMRGIYEFHVNGRGWNDIGYNVLVDRFGRLWEGRAGGVDKAVVGAHAQGVNSQTFGISAMGDYDQTAAPDAMTTSIERLMAWKLARHHVDPTAKATIGGEWLPTVVGHRSVGQTTCPGQYFTARLPEIRTDARARQGTAFYTPSTSPRRVAYGTGGSALQVRTTGDVTWRVRISSDKHGVISDRSSTRTGDTDLTMTWKGRLADGSWAPPGEYEVLLSGKDTSSGAWIPSWRDTVTVTS